MGYIYRIDFPDGYFYIGSTKCKYLSKRLGQHKKDKLWLVKEDPYSISRFVKYVKDYGWNNPKIYIIEQCLDDERTDKEFALISKLIDNPKNLNSRCRGRSSIYAVKGHASSCSLGDLHHLSSTPDSSRNITL